MRSSGGLAGGQGAMPHPPADFFEGAPNFKWGARNFMKFDGSIVFFPAPRSRWAFHTDASDANASIIVTDKSFPIHAKFRKTDTNCYSSSNSFYVNREI